MRRISVRLLVLNCLAVLLWVSAPAAAQITIVQDSDAVVVDFTGEVGNRLNGNDFESYLLDNGFTVGLADADIDVDGPGTFSFELIGARTGRVNAFEVGGSIAATGGGGFQSFIQPNGVNGQAINATATVDEAGEIPNRLFGFRTSTNGGSSFGGLSTFFSNRFATFVPNLNTLSGLTTVIFAFEEFSGTTDYDDLLVRATFTPVSAVPEPETWLMLILGLGLLVWRLRGV